MKPSQPHAWSLTLSPLVLVAAMMLVLVACGDDRGNGGGGNNAANQNPEDCTADQFYNAVLKRCIARADAGSNNVVEDAEDQNNEGQPDADVANNDQPDVEEDIVEEDVPGPGCDEDGDGALSMACGGDDCDDRDFSRAPFRDELCDARDNNCNGQINEGVSCTFFAHSGDSLYAVDPFNLSATLVNSNLPGLQDIDTHPDGTLWGVTRAELFRYDAQSNRWINEGTFPNRIEDANGLAIDSEGTAYVTSGDSLYAVDLSDAQTRLIGQVGANFYSSGDCVVNKLDSLFMTSKAEDVPDTLVFVDRATGRGQEIGSIGFSRVFGLTAGWGFLYGLTSEGELITIDSSTGRGTLLTTFADITFFGAASAPAR